MRHRDPVLPRPAQLARVAAVLLLAATAPAQVELPALFADGMVLQRDAEAPVWGRAQPGEVVRVQGSWMEEELETEADAGGHWRVDVPTPAAGGPHRLSIRPAGGEERVVDDVWVGEVWIASGQSNMEWPLSRAASAGEEIPTADHPRMRFFKVKSEPSMTPAEDCDGRWLVCEPWKVGLVSAVGYHFGLELLRELDVPIGIINVTWGGTPAMAWTSARTLRARGDFAAQLARIQGALDEPETYASLDEQRSAWWSRLESAEIGTRAGWMDVDLDDADWDDVILPGTWAEAGLGEFDGCVWYRRRLDIPDEWQTRRLLLELGPIDDMDRTWFNGQLIGDSSTEGLWNVPRTYPVPALALRPDGNVVTICAVDSGGAGRVGNAEIPMRLRRAQGDDERTLDLSGPWKFRAGSSLEELGGWPRDHWFDQNYPTSLFNGFLSPVMPYAMRGVIWYQGESDVARYATYRTLFPDMIRDWRTAWGRGEFPFYFVQIAPFAYADDTGQAAFLREAQAMALALLATGMAVTMDIGEPGDIHPSNKLDVGRRLAALALGRTYGRDDVVCEGPVYRSMTVEEDRVRLEFEHASGLHSGGAALACFRVAGADRVFHPATAVIEGESVVVTCEAVTRPLAVRFGWGAADVTDLANAAGLPAASFRTDDWE